MKLLRVKITKLFGSLDHDLHFDNDINIMYGKNGSGKTTILTLLNAIFSGDFYRLSTIKFQKIECHFSNNSILYIHKALENETPIFDLDNLDSKYLLMALENNSNEIQEEFIDPNYENISDDILDSIENEIPHLDRVSNRLWRNIQTGEILSLQEVIERYGIDYPFLQPEFENSWYSELLANFTVNLIHTKRHITFLNNLDDFSDDLFFDNTNKQKIANTVDQYSREIKEIIKNTQAESAKIALNLDSSFPKRLLGNEILDYDVNKLIQMAEELESLRVKLEQSGLLQDTEIINIQNRLNETSDQKALYFYLTDTLQKFKVYEDLEQKISLFTKIINSKFDGKKYISVSIEKGLKIRNDKQEVIHPQFLSSGEQHEIIMMYDLIFKSQENMLVMIDEPEISLHIDWQRNFIEDIDAISKLNKLRFIIATHSPAIIGNKFNLLQEAKL